jgi:hypothetical protein
MMDEQTCWTRYIANGLDGKDGAVVVDMRNFRHISVDPSSFIAIWHKNHLGEVALGLNNAGRALPHGSCLYVGFGGHSSNAECWNTRTRSSVVCCAND